jgi:hypothetical protein
LAPELLFEPELFEPELFSPELLFEPEFEPPLFEPELLLFELLFEPEFEPVLLDPLFSPFEPELLEPEPDLVDDEFSFLLEVFFDEVLAPDLVDVLFEAALSDEPCTE